jgi:LacI family gluconate utilization system Gnt-I transcriptional repressor
VAIIRAKHASSAKTASRAAIEAGATLRLEEVAEAAGVSTITVSRCINNPGRVSAKTREHVLRVAATMGYVPNRLASSLASARSKVVGAVVPTLANPIHAEMLQGVTDILGPAGYQLLLGTSGYSLQSEEDVVRTFISHRVDAMLLTGKDHRDDCMALLARSAIPTVEVFEQIDDPFDLNVGSSNFDAGLSLAQYLIARGRRTLAFVGHSDVDDSRIEERWRGVVAACRDAGLAAPKLYTAASDPGSGGGGEIIGAILRDAPSTDAVIFAGHQIAVGAIRHALDTGIAVPQRAAVASFGDSPIARWIKPSLTTVRFPVRDMGLEAGRLLLTRLSGEEVRLRTVRLGFEIISRESG